MEQILFFIVRCLREKERGGIGVTISELRAFAGGGGEVDERREELALSGVKISLWRMSRCWVWRMCLQ